MSKSCWYLWIKIHKHMHRYQHDFDKDIEILIIKGTVMQIEKALINDRLHVSKVS